jgi:hypothetical protein
MNLPQTLKIWAEVSGMKVLNFRPHREGWIVNNIYYIYQTGADIHESKRID